MNQFEKQNITSGRIEWIDLAKGFCIALVVLDHVALFYNQHYPFDYSLRAFRMPFYYSLSGIFFKEYDGFISFMKRKVNKLLIPYIFYFFFLSVVLPSILYYLFHIEVRYFFGMGLKGLEFIGREGLNPNAPIWFLLSLFQCNLIFYAVTPPSTE